TTVLHLRCRTGTNCSSRRASTRLRATRGSRRTPGLPQTTPLIEGGIRRSTLAHQCGVAGSAIASRPDMRVETRQPSASDVQASIDSALTAGEVRRTDTQVRVGPPAILDADGLRTAAAWAA